MALTFRLSLREETEPPVCSSCGKLLHPKERGTQFYCPNCGQVVITRDNGCRKGVVTYVCPNCGFEGP